MRPNKTLKHVQTKLTALAALKTAYEHEHNFSLRIVGELGDMARDILRLRTDVQQLQITVRALKKTVARTLQPPGDAAP